MNTVGFFVEAHCCWKHASSQSFLQLSRSQWHARVAVIEGDCPSWLEAETEVVLLFVLILLGIILQVLLHHCFTLSLPFFPIDLCIVKELITRDAKDSTCK